MNVGWIFPHREKCGIAIYARNYIGTAALSGSVLPIDPSWWINDRQRIVETIRKCDIIHIQYDTATFMHHHRDFYPSLLHAITTPVVVSLHEVYKEDPFAFPRSALRGTGPVKTVRRIMYDHRHPVQRAFDRHVKHAFYAQRLIVHHDYHRSILTGKKISSSKITVIPTPVKRTRFNNAFSFSTLPRLNFGAIGFISPAYNYDLLFSVLESCRRPWTFTWIGGPRSDDGCAILDMIHNRIRSNGWSDKFSITGWVPEERLTRCLDAVDIVLAFFALRSSSGSLATAMGALKPVCATLLPLTGEIAGFLKNNCGKTYGAPLLITDTDLLTPLLIVEQIEAFVSSSAMQRKLFTNLVKYTTEVSFERCAGKLVDLYRKLLEQ